MILQRWPKSLPGAPPSPVQARPSSPIHRRRRRRRSTRRLNAPECSGRKKKVNSKGSGVSKDTIMASSGEVEEDGKGETTMTGNEEKEGESKDGITCEDVLVGHGNGGEVKKRKWDHMKSFDDKETIVEKRKKKKEKDDVVVAGIEGKKVERKMEMMRNDRKAHEKEKRRKMKSDKDVMEDEANCEVLKPKKIKRALVIPESKKCERVRFSDEVKVFPPSDSPQSSDENKGGLVHGKRFSKEEDELIKKAVDKYLKAMKLGEEGLNMILECKSHPLVKGCWNVIADALPWRPYSSVYQRGRRLYIRGESKWTNEEVEHIRESYKKYGPKWKMMADELGKNRDHVRSAFKRYQFVDLKKGKWSQDEYQTLFELVNEDLLMKVSEEKKSNHGMLRDNIRWEAISERLGTRYNGHCCQKWYNQLTSPMVAQGEWADVDDYRLLFVLVDLDASCEDEVDWDCLLQHRSGDLCRKRWLQMARHLGEHGNKSFSEQVEVVSKRYCPDFAEVREALDARPVVD